MKKFFYMVFLSMFVVSCSEEEATMPAPDLFLQKATFSEIKDWNKDNHGQALKTFLLSCEKIKKEKGEYLSSSKIKINTNSYKEICKKAKSIRSSDFKRFIEDNFVPHLVLWKGSPEGKFTSYYESQINASTTPSEKYKYPIYGRPNDLIEINLKDFDSSLPNKRFVGRIENKRFVPYYTRDEIYKNGINAPVVLWGDSYIDIYIMQIQGSAVAKLEDGREVRISFADTNGHEFKGIGSILLEQKLIPVGEASMLGIKKWLQKNPELAVKNMNKNKRYIFHRINADVGPIGAQGLPLTAGRSLAVDRSFVPLGALLWLETKGPKKENIHKIMLAQDIGGAIKGAIRGDYFWGSGDDEVLDLAGKMNSVGQYYILIPKTRENK